MTMNIYTILDELSIPYKKIDHPPVFTSEQARELIPEQQAASAKNLLLRDKKGKNYFLIVFDDKKTLDMKQLAEQIGSSRLSLASPERLKTRIKVDPGAVSLLALVNDVDNQVDLLFDRALWGNVELLQCHPLVNTVSLILAMRDVERFLKQVEHTVRLVDI